MSDFLTSMAISSKARSEAAQRLCSESEAVERCEGLPATTPIVQPNDSMGVIAEIKVRSPAEGVLADDVTTETVVARAAEYVDGGASVLSVLTEPLKFEGSLDYLSAIKTHIGEKAAVMRKDFLVDTYQLYEARLHGADGVLLIARILSQSELERMLLVCQALGLFVLLEGFDEADLSRMANYASDTVLLGLNCRDLMTLQIDPSRFARYIDRFPAQAIKVAESGIHTVEEAAQLHALGYDMALIGTMLMKTHSPSKTLRQLCEATGGS